MGALKFDLRQAMQDYEARTGIRLTYDALAQRSDVSVDALKSMATRDDYNTTLNAIAALADALKCDPVRYLRWYPAEK